MRGDINFLDSMKQGEKKRNSNTTTAIAVILVVVLIGVLGFLFIKAKITYNQNADLMKQLEQEKVSSKYPNRDQEYLKAKRQFESYITETSSKDAAEDYLNRVHKLSRDMFDAIFNATDNNGAQEVTINDFTFDCYFNSIAINCEAIGTGAEDDLRITKEYMEAFVERLSGATIVNASGDEIKIFKSSLSVSTPKMKVTKDGDKEIKGWSFTVNAELVATATLEG